MIVLSLVLVIVAAVTLIAGFFQDESLTLIYVAIVSCVLAMGFLGVGVLQRKRSSTPATAPSGGYGPGTGSAAPVRPSSGTAAPTRAPVRPGGAESAATSEPMPATGDDTEVIVRKTDAGDQATVKKAVAKKAVGKRAVVKKATAASPDATVTKASAADVAAKKAPAKKAPAKAATSKKATAKKTTAKKTTKQAAAKKSTTKKAGTKKAAAKRPTAASKAEVREILSSVKGLGPAKQDAILAEFGSVAALKQASEEQLADIRGVGAGLAAAIKKAVK